MHKLPMMNKDGTFGMCGGVATPPEQGGDTYLSQRGNTTDVQSQSPSWPLTQKQLSLSF